MNNNDRRARTTKPSGVREDFTLQNEAQRELLALGLSCAALARAGGASKMSASRWLRGLLTPSIESQDALTLSLGLPSVLWYRLPARTEYERLVAWGLEPAAALKLKRPGVAPFDVLVAQYTERAAQKAKVEPQRTALSESPSVPVRCTPNHDDPYG